MIHNLVNKTFKHYDYGHLYVVTSVGRMVPRGTGEDQYLVSYRRLGASPENTAESFVTPIERFMGMVDKGGSIVQRFTPYNP